MHDHKRVPKLLVDSANLLIWVTKSTGRDPRITWAVEQQSQVSDIPWLSAETSEWAYQKGWEQNFGLKCIETLANDFSLCS